MNPEPCKEVLENGEYCNERAYCILWGKLFPPEALGPRCFDHTKEHFGCGCYRCIQQSAAYLLPDEDDYLVRIDPAAIEALADWTEVEGVKLRKTDDDRIEVLMTKDVELARFVDYQNRSTKNTEA